MRDADAESLGKVLCEPAQGIRVCYRELSGRYPYRIECIPERDANDDELFRVLNRMRSSFALDGLEEHRHFRWLGLSSIGFRSKGRAALLALQMSG